MNRSNNVPNPEYLMKNQIESATQSKNSTNLCECKLINKQRKQLQHKIKIYLEKYYKSSIGKSADYLNVAIWDDMVIIRGEKFLTEPEKYLVKTPKGSDIVKASRLEVVQQCAIDYLPYFEAQLGAKCIHQTFNIESETEFYIHVFVFDQLLIDQ